MSRTKEDTQTVCPNNKTNVCLMLEFKQLMTFGGYIQYW